MNVEEWARDEVARIERRGWVLVDVQWAPDRSWCTIVSHEPENMRIVGRMRHTEDDERA